MEEWLETKVKGYFVSSLGRVRSPRARILSPSVAGRGYLSVCIAGKKEYVHRLVAMCFIGPATGPQVNHKNGIKFDNRAANLEWVNNSENQKHSIRLGLRTPTRHMGNKFSRKLTEIQIKELKNLRREGWLVKELSDKFCITGTTVRNIYKGRTCKDFTPGT